MKTLDPESWERLMVGKTPSILEMFTGSQIMPWDCGVGTNQTTTPHLCPSYFREKAQMFSLCTFSDTKWKSVNLKFLVIPWRNNAGQPEEYLIPEKLYQNKWLLISDITPAEFWALTALWNFSKTNFILATWLRNVLAPFSSLISALGVSSPVLSTFFCSAGHDNTEWQPSEVCQEKNGHRTQHGGRDPCMAHGIWPLLHYLG